MSVAYFRDPLPSALLLACGFTCTQVPAEWEDDGDVENGPNLTGHDDYDSWTKEEVDHVHEVIMVEHKVVDSIVYPSYIFNY